MAAWWNPFAAWKKAGERVAALGRQDSSAPLAGVRRQRVDQLHPERTSEQVDARRSEARRKAMEAVAPVRMTQRPIAELEQTGPIKSGRKRSRSVRARLKQDPNAPHTRVGKSARFVYVDADGVVTDRQIVNWSIAGHFIEGFCLDRKQIRTFRLDRIDEWIDAE